jgi:hypothetical protein
MSHSINIVYHSITKKKSVSFLIYDLGVLTASLGFLGVRSVFYSFFLGIFQVLRHFGMSRFRLICSESYTLSLT